MSETRATALVLTALPVEYDAVRTHLAHPEERVHEDGTRVECGPLDDSSWNLAIAELGEGAVTAAALTTQLVGWLRPEAVLFVGVAGGLRDDIGIGDVVVGTKVYAVQGGKRTPQGFLARPQTWHGSHRLVQAARSALRQMRDVPVHFKPIACGDVVLADDRSEYAAHIREHYNGACAIEMEGSGAAHAAHLNGQLDALVIRGVSDHADADKHRADASGSQQRAAEQAARVAVAVLRRHRPRAGSSGGGAVRDPGRPGSHHDTARAQDGSPPVFRDAAFGRPAAGRSGEPER
ncbi:5'-methylthioadenosine/S-adenosylhomocysteine nucleosidase [Streptomyces sp. NBC_00704]|uniref:5'-methylthioadenosine/S-adenosylhomocysteine nucleosidase n=1 Tax=Streptomyces sp. NBC_00704 TaxID=2975809 RepID=UPI002E35C49C|nr:5'-methylthioadenosine/S-adenosylhomocysteine nucleosidase [Streptomyces sp. NBC_00704]